MKTKNLSEILESLKDIKMNPKDGIYGHDFEDFLHEDIEEDIELSKAEGRTRAERRRNNQIKINHKRKVIKNSNQCGYMKNKKSGWLDKNKPTCPVCGIKNISNSNDIKIQMMEDKIKEHKLIEYQNSILYDIGDGWDGRIIDTGWSEDDFMTFDELYDYYYSEWLEKEAEWKEMNKFIDSAEYWGDDIKDIKEEL